MEMPSHKPVKIGYRYGLILLIFGLIIVAINAAMLFSNNTYLPKLLTVGMAMTIISPVFFVFPGGKLYQMPETKNMGKALVQNAPTLHKVMWFVWGIASIAIALFALISFDPHFYN